MGAGLERVQRLPAVGAQVARRAAQFGGQGAVLVERLGHGLQRLGHVGMDADVEGHALQGVGMIELPPPGLGSLNYDVYLQRLAKTHPNIPIIIEHLDESAVPRAKQFIDSKLMAHGL